MIKQYGHRIVGTIKAVKGTCVLGYKAGDQIELSSHETGGLCGFLYHAVFPEIVMLEFGGSFPWGDPDVIERDCVDKSNQVTIELRRIKSGDV